MQAGGRGALCPPREPTHTFAPTEQLERGDSMKRQSAVVATIAIACLVAVAATAQDTGDPPPAQRQVGIPDDVAEVVRAFVPDDLRITTDLDAVSIRRSEAAFTGRPTYDFHVTTETADGTAWDHWFEIDVERLYVDFYSTRVQDPDPSSRRPTREIALTRDEAEAVAREFAAERFPRPLDTLKLAWVSEPPRASSSFRFLWHGREGE